MRGARSVLFAAAAAVAAAATVEAARFYHPGTGSTVDVTINPRMSRPSTPARERPEPREPRERYNSDDYSPSNRAAYDGPGIEVLIEPLVEAFKAIANLADQTSKPLRDLVRRVIDERRQARERRAARQAMIDAWGRIRDERVRGLRERLAERLPITPPKAKEKCPPGQVAVPAGPSEPPSGSPGAPPSADPEQLKLIEDCAKIEKEIEAACGGAPDCESRSVPRYLDRGCGERWSNLGGGPGSGPTGTPPNLIKKVGSNWCVPQRLATPRNLAWLAGQPAFSKPAGGAGGSGKDDNAEAKKEVKASLSEASLKKLQNVLRLIDEWLGPGATLIKNQHGDLVILSKDKQRQIRVDSKHTHPHQSPHAHVEYKNAAGKWIKSGPIYPNDVPHR